MNNKKINGKHYLMMIATIVTIIGGIAGTLYYLGIIPFEKTPDFELSANSTTLYYDKNFEDYFQTTHIIITNNGEIKATEVTIDIIFPSEISIYNYTCKPKRDGISGGHDEEFISLYFNSLEIFHSINITINSKLKNSNDNQLPIQPNYIRVISNGKTKILV